MEHTRSLKVSIEKDTNKSTYSQSFELGEINEDETLEEFVERVKNELDNLIE